MLAVSAPALAQTQPLPAPSGRPMAIDFASDPVLGLSRTEGDFAAFRALIAGVVERHPGTAEFAANEDAALAAVEEAREAQLPSVDLSITSYRVIARDFSNDPSNIIERSRPEQRTDAIASVAQTLFDFGAGERRVTAAGARLRAAAAELEGTADRIAVNAIATWYELFGFRALVALTDAFIASQRDLRSAVEIRIRDGVSAESDLSRVDSYIAQAETRMAIYRRRLAGAEARFEELTGFAPPAALQRAPAPPIHVANRDEAALAAMDAAAVRVANAAAAAARNDARAARADRLPQIVAGVDAGRYGVFENDRDYDIRGRIALRYRLFGGTDPRAEQVEARARSADARAARISEEAARDASIAFSDMKALEQQLAALNEAYVASRVSRDAIVERFVSARGTLFDVVAAEDAYFTSATSYIQALTELDASRYILLSRTGRLLEILQINPDRLRGEG